MGSIFLRHQATKTYPDLASTQFRIHSVFKNFHSGERIQNVTDSYASFIWYVWTEAVSKNIQIPVDRAQKSKNVNITDCLHYQSPRVEEIVCQMIWLSCCLSLEVPQTHLPPPLFITVGWRAWELVWSYLFRIPVLAALAREMQPAGQDLEIMVTFASVQVVIMEIDAS